MLTVDKRAEVKCLGRKCNGDVSADHSMSLYLADPGMLHAPDCSLIAAVFAGPSAVFS